MLEQLKYVGIPAKVIVCLLCVYLLVTFIGAILDFKGKMVPTFINCRKWWRNRKSRKQAIEQIPMLVQQVTDFNSHYSKDNIERRDSWIDGVNNHIHISEPTLQSIKEDILEIKIENMRSSILDFAGRVAKEEYPATREQFNRIFKQYAKYEKTIEENNLTNGEVDVAHRIIQEAYEARLKDRAFIEDIRGYGVK